MPLRIPQKRYRHLSTPRGKNVFYSGCEGELSRHFSSVARRLRGYQKAASPHPKGSAPTEALLSHICFAKNFSLIFPIPILCRFRKRQGLSFPHSIFQNGLYPHSPNFRYVSVVFAKEGHRTFEPNRLGGGPNKTRSFR